ncbi:A/G-specific adenine glycosylase [Chelativorans sp. AA-79]|uniref:A/G-specific adenine glycosylase n=1 Tax=Chelativorans sp. AA-79 TaxID=3028735 RepID=UPI0023F9D41E|nr:A/G-specific adenine glycosylase [Chelativorans sp. AA-79]WEX07810.1 A/G-specific adenine glycosylase [Chelativorans sp. AA-79]
MTAVETEAGNQVGDALLAWYDRHHRRLPWRMPPDQIRRGHRPDPYRVWLSEIMLQQTTVGAVKPYFDRFLQRWPTVEALAAADIDDVMKAWAGLGYYSRARNLKKCAEAVSERHDGAFPATEGALKALPGIGEYTAAAIAAIAFDRPAAVVDGNVERVITRLRAIETPLPAAKGEIREIVAALLPETRPGDFAQAMMDLGATICTPRRPSCILCPVAADCVARGRGMQELFPIKAPKAEKPTRQGAAFVAVRADGAVLLRQRPVKGLLGGMTEVPTTAWNARQDGARDAAAAPFPADWRGCGVVAHVFTHFALHLSVFRAEVEGLAAPAGHWWSAPEELLGEALPTVMKKAIEAAIPGATKARRPITQ